MKYWTFLALMALIASCRSPTQVPPQDSVPNPSQELPRISEVDEYESKFGRQTKTLVELARKSGDPLEKDRVVTFYAQFSKLEDAQGFSREAVGAGFRPNGDTLDDGKIGVAIEKQLPATAEALDRWGRWAFERAIHFKGEYDGFDFEALK